MTGISSVTVNNMVDDTGDGMSGTPYNKTFMQSFINDLIATALPLDGSVAMTGALQELFIGLVRKLNPNGTAHIYEYAGGLLATTTAPTGNGFQQMWTYNVPLATTTVPPTVNAWGTRDLTDFCVLVQFLDTGIFEIWFAPSAAAGTAPVWGTGPVFSFNASTGVLSNVILGDNTVRGNALYSARHVWEPCIQDWMGHFRVAAGAPGTAVINGYLMSSYASSTEIFAPGLAVQLNAIDFPIRFRAACAVGALANNNGVMRLYNSNNDMIAIQFDGAANTLTAGCYSGGIPSPLTTTYNYAANTIIYLTIEVVSASSINFYASTSLNTLGTLIANRTTNIPTTLPLTPYLGNHGVAAFTFYTRDVIFEIG